MSSKLKRVYFLLFQTQYDLLFTFGEEQKFDATPIVLINFQFPWINPLDNTQRKHSFPHSVKNLFNITHLASICDCFSFILNVQDSMYAIFFKLSLHTLQLQTFSKLFNLVSIPFHSSILYLLSTGYVYTFSFPYSVMPISQALWTSPFLNKGFQKWSTALMPKAG